MSSFLKDSIPKDWNVIKCEQCCNLITVGIVVRPSSYYVQNGIPTLRNKNIKEDRLDLTDLVFISEEDNNTRALKSQIKKGDVLVARSGKPGIACTVPEELNGVNCIDILILRPRIGIVISKFLSYYFNSNLTKKQVYSMKTGMAQQHLNVGAVKKVKILIPSIEEQKKIALILSNVDDLILKTEKIIEVLQILKKGLMQRLFTEGIGHTEFKETRVGKIPKGWEIKKLGDLITIYDSDRIPLSQAERNERKGNFSYCGATGIIDYINDYIFDGEYVLLAEDGGPFGKFENSAYIMSGKFWVNNHAHVIQAIHGQTTNSYLLYVLNYLSLIPYIVGSTRQKLNQGDLKKIKIPIPNLEEQEFIVKFLSNLDKKTNYERLLNKILKKIKTGLMQDLLTGKKKVKIN